VILVLAEAVTLPEELAKCAVYDARTRFDRTMQNLTAYLCGQQPACHDPLPDPRWEKLPMKMPFDVWLTICILFLVAYLELVIAYTSAYSNTARVRFSFLEFWRHNTSPTILSGERLRLLSFWTLFPLLAYTFVVFVLFGNPGYPASYLVPIIFLGILVYWVIRVWRGSPDILRWLPPDAVDQTMRERIQASLQHIQSKDQPETVSVRYALHYHPADRYNAEYIESELLVKGSQPILEDQAEIQLILVSNRTSKQWLLERNSCLAGSIIHILVTDINLSPEIEHLRQKQWFDFRSGRLRTLQAFCDNLTQTQGANLLYAMQVTPLGFDTSHSSPASVRWVTWTFMIGATLISVGGILALGQFGYWGWFDLAMVLVWILALGYITRILERDTGLPALFHKWMGHRLAWFASPAPPAPDAIGNFIKSREKIIY
jgi:hypothetical protein